MRPEVMLPMPSAPLLLPLSDYSRIAHAFVELRGKGLSLSAADLEVLRSWRERAVPPVALLELLFALAEECEQEGKGFPLSLKSIDTRVKRALRDGQFHRFFDAPQAPEGNPLAPSDVAQGKTEQRLEPAQNPKESSP